jgi:hypothetical protein
MFNFDSISLKANDYSDPNYIGSKFRKKRFLIFEQLIQDLNKPVTILDIGGTVRFWVDEGYQKRDALITIVNIRAEKSEYNNIRVLKGNAVDLSQFKDKAFDISFSNSLIEHLYTLENQRKMASEAMRVGKYFFIQTPNRYFPIEPHFKFLYFQFLPHFLQVFLQTKTSLINGVRYKHSYAEQIVKEIRLLSKSELKNLFPKCKLYTERFMWLRKSFIAHNF